MKHKVVLMLFALVAAASGSVFAKGDPVAGRAKAAVCAACHGPGGMSPTDAAPNLTAQGHAYVVLQLKAFRDGSRKSALMEPMAKPLSDQDIDNLAAYYSTSKPGVAVASSPAAPGVAVGIAPAKGDAAAGRNKAAGCANCHGPTGMSPTDAFPNLAGQVPAYIVQQLQAFRDGSRKNQLMNPHGENAVRARHRECRRLFFGAEAWSGARGVPGARCSCRCRYRASPADHSGGHRRPRPPIPPGNIGRTSCLQGRLAQSSSRNASSATTCKERSRSRARRSNGRMWLAG